MKTLFLYDKDANIKEAEKILKERFSDIEILPFGFDFEFEEDSFVFLMIDDDEFKKFICLVKVSLKVVILPFFKNPLTQKAFNIPPNLNDALELAFKDDTFLDKNILFYNGKAVFDCINIGSGEWIEDRSFFGFFKRPRLFGVLIETKEKSLKSASFLIESSSEAFLFKKRAYFFKGSENFCDRIATLIYSPKSVFQALKLRYFFAVKKKNSKTLPQGIGVIKSDYLKISSLDKSELFVSFEGKNEKSGEIVLENREIEAKIVTGWKGCGKQKERKESLRVQNVSLDDEVIEFYTKRKLPFVRIASEEAFAELFTKLKEAARGSVAYGVLLILSVLMATVGLFQNSSPTIIGAMILAPLMGPIIAFSMGAIRFDSFLLANSLKTLFISVVFTLFISAVFTYFMPFYHITNQMAIRTHPTLLDLAVAVISGVAAAYGYSNSKVGESLAGVAIAVALVPPLCVSGIGIGWGSFSIFYNALLLFLTNIVGIVFAAGVTFYLLGYASVRYASGAFLIKMLMVLIIAFPLYFSTKSVVLEEKIYEKISKINELEFDKNRVWLKLIGVFHDKEGVFAKICVRSFKELSFEEKSQIAKKIKNMVGENISVILSYETVYK